MSCRLRAAGLWLALVCAASCAHHPDVSAPVGGGAAASPLKPRIVVPTDISPITNEPDDSESLIRLLVHADLFEIEALIATSGWSAPVYPPAWSESRDLHDQPQVRSVFFIRPSSTTSSRASAGPRRAPAIEILSWWSMAFLALM